MRESVEEAVLWPIGQPGARIIDSDITMSLYYRVSGGTRDEVHDQIPFGLEIEGAILGDTK